MYLHVRVAPSMVGLRKYLGLDNTSGSCAICIQQPRHKWAACIDRELCMRVGAWACYHVICRSMAIYFHWGVPLTVASKLW